MILFRSHGITRDPNFLSKKNPVPWHYEQIELGMNYRITDIQAALAASQLKRIGKFVKKRNNLAERYNSDLRNLPIELPWINEDCLSAYHLYVIRLKLHEISNNQRQVFEFLQKMGILVNVHYIPVHLHPIYRKIGFKNGDFPLAEKYYKEIVKKFPDNVNTLINLGMTLKQLEKFNEAIDCYKRSIKINPKMLIHIIILQIYIII